MIPTYVRKTKDMFISEQFRSLIDQFKEVSPVAKSLLHKRISNESLVDDHINYICVSQSDPTKISYLTQDRIKKIEGSQTHDFWTSTQRFHCKPGAFVSKVLKGVSERDIEKFANMFKAFSNKKDFTFNVLKGTKSFIESYLHENYASQRGSLGVSCMKYQKCGSFLNIYGENEKVCSILVMNNPHQQVIGRAILWDFTDPITGISHKIMDRIYTIQDDEWEIFFKNWATQNGYLYKSKQNYFNCLQFEDNTSSQQELRLAIKLENFDHDLYPYLDTFKWIDLKEGILYNHCPENFSKNNIYQKILIAPDGAYENDPEYFGFDDIERAYYYNRDLVEITEHGIRTSVNNCRYSDSMDRYLLSSEALLRWQKLSQKLELVEV